MAKSGGGLVQNIGVEPGTPGSDSAIVLNTTGMHTIPGVTGNKTNFKSLVAAGSTGMQSANGAFAAAIAHAGEINVEFGEIPGYVFWFRRT